MRKINFEVTFQLVRHNSMYKCILAGFTGKLHAKSIQSWIKKTGLPVEAIFYGSSAWPMRFVNGLSGPYFTAIALFLQNRGLWWRYTTPNGEIGLDFSTSLENNALKIR
ncbi:hypothetical protein [Paenibacillus chartarius]|uniref:hypothetical protein n=1 Tax=Paenibacillus chartarius TaxID=747481 RepID=UPI00366D3105